MVWYCGCWSRYQADKGKYWQRWGWKRVKDCWLKMNQIRNYPHQNANKKCEVTATECYRQQTILQFQYPVSFTISDSASLLLWSMTVHHFRYDQWQYITSVTINDSASLPLRSMSVHHFCYDQCQCITSVTINVSASLLLQSMSVHHFCLILKRVLQRWLTDTAGSDWIPVSTLITYIVDSN